MPLYEYECISCGNHFEVLQKITDAPISTCEKCGAKKVQKVISKTSFVLKGTGWYETDFKGKSTTSTASKESLSSGSSESSSSSSSDKTETKPAKKEATSS